MTRTFSIFKPTFRILRRNRKSVDVDRKSTFGGLDQLVEAFHLPKIFLRLLDLAGPLGLNGSVFELLLSLLKK